MLYISAMIKIFSVIYLPAVRFLGDKFNFQSCLLVSAIKAKKKLCRLKFPFHHSSTDFKSLHKTITGLIRGHIKEGQGKIDIFILSMSFI